jgi:hypothetical protein
MSSILKVDQLKDSGGNAIITSDGSGNITTGTGMGKVLQIVRTYDADSSQISTTSTSFTATGIQASITPTKSGNLILIDWVCSMTNKDASGYGLARMYQKIGSATIASMSGAGTYHVNYSNFAYNKYAPSCFGGSYTATSTDTLIYEPYIASSNAATYQFVHVNSSYALTLTEVEQ